MYCNYIGCETTIKDLRQKNFTDRCMYAICITFSKKIIDDLTLFTTIIIAYAAYCCRVYITKENDSDHISSGVYGFKWWTYNWYFYYHNYLPFANC